MELKANHSAESNLKSFPKYPFYILALFFVAAGLNHFVHPAPYISMMPPWLPAPVLLVQLSGIAEIIGGLGLLFPKTCKWACWGLIAIGANLRLPKDTALVEFFVSESVL